MSDPNDRYAGLTEEERAFAEGFGDEVIEQQPAQPQSADPAPDGGTETQGGVDTPENAEQPAAQDDPLAALPDELRNRYIELESAQRSLAAELEQVRAREAQLRNDNAAMAGRLKPLQQRLAEIERQGAPAPQPSQPQGADDIAALFATEDFAEFERMFPTEAKLQKEKILGAVSLTEKRLQSEIARLTQRIEQFSPVVQQIATQSEEAEWQRKVKALSDIHPDYQQIDKNPQFWEWLNRDYTQSLPPMLRAQMADQQFRQQLFADPESVATILTQFKARNPAAVAPATERNAPVAKAADPRLALSAAPNVGSSATRAVNIAALPPEEQFLAGFNS